MAVISYFPISLPEPARAGFEQSWMTRVGAVDTFPGFIMEADILLPDGFFVLEHTSKKVFDKVPGFREARHYGQSVFSFFGSGS